MSNFNFSYDKTAINEGGYANDSADAGGETWKGIARKMHPSWAGWAIIDSYRSKPGFPGILKNDQHLDGLVKEFYKTNFWQVIRGDEIISHEIAASIYDSAVNMGPKQAIILAQRSLGVPETGHMDNLTLDKLNNK